MWWLRCSACSSFGREAVQLFVSVLLLLDIGVVYQWDSARLLTDPSQEVTAAVVRGSRSELI